MKPILLIALFFSFTSFVPKALSMPAHILLIRHGEKPDSGDELSPRGWDRAKALPSLFEREPYAGFGAPAALFGMAPKSQDEIAAEPPANDGTKNEDEGSVRAIQTLKYVSEKFGLKIIDKYKKGDEQALADQLRTDDKLNGKFVVVCWEHKALTDLAADLGVDPAPKYPGSHFDRAWLLTMDGDKVARFQDLPENLLPGDDQN